MRKAFVSMLLCIFVVSLAGCGAWRDFRDRAEKNRYVSNRYPPNPVTGLKTVGVVVLDASPTREADTREFSSALHSELQHVEGLEVVPDAVVVKAVETGGFLLPRDGLKLADALSLDGLFVAIVTGYDPYQEPVVAAGLTLFSRAAAPLSPIDLDRVIQGARPLPMPTGPSAQPVTAVFAVYDASQQTLRRKIRWFAEGHTSSDVGLGWQRYYRSMPLYMRFVSYEMTWRIFARLDEDILKGRISARSAETSKGRTAAHPPPGQ